ncbi:hypothetical protein SKAU_G00017100 [Synaphobranchus kaupii]|uniref:Uncharacterized protein n=1 Tax=Synaphobranchus kaupii TaxID=118154 RepID=A0A9Q1GBF3_SYNKA|nr:hypothetical protein SKAU_G00017100 [Synaphobranchus kaupii]
MEKMSSCTLHQTMEEPAASKARPVMANPDLEDLPHICDLYLCDQFFGGRWGRLSPHPSHQRSRSTGTTGALDRTGRQRGGAPEQASIHHSVGDHLIEFPLDQSISLVLIQPPAAQKCLLDPREWTIYHHLKQRSGGKKTCEVEGNKMEMDAGPPSRSTNRRSPRHCRGQW